MTTQCYRCRGINMQRLQNGGLHCPDCKHQWQPRQPATKPEPDARSARRRIVIVIAAAAATIALCITIAVLALVMADVNRADYPPNSPSYPNCDAAIAAEGQGNFPTRHPAYSSVLDGDNDGTACER